MSQENVEIVRSIYEAVARRDDVTPFQLYAEDIVWDVTHAPTAMFYSSAVIEGHDGIRRVWREALAAFAEIDFHAEELIDAGDRVVAVVRERELGRASGVPVEASHYAVWTLADGKAVRMEVFADRMQALDAAGLSE